MTVSTADFLTYCRTNNETLLVTAMEAEKNVEEIASLPRRLLIVFGSEKEGCSPEIEAAATMRVRIPINPQVESLNVSAAAGITLFQRANFNRTA
jgi:TrmH family RNA methyltransferase